MFFDLIKNNLRSVHLHTEMLEACGWDEDYLDQQLQVAVEFFNEYTPEVDASWEIILADCQHFMENNLEESLSSIIIDMVNHHGKEIMELMKLEEN